MEYRFPVPVGTVPAKSQTLQQGIGIREACAGLTDVVGIGEHHELGPENIKNFDLGIHPCLL